MGFALGASQVGEKPIFEFQFADFSTETVTQLGLNIGTWYFRTGCPAPILVRLPCGGGLTMGGFHSGEFEGLWSRFPGLKLLYPATAQETFEALVAGFYDPNPCLVFEHKLLYWSKSGPIDFDGDLAKVWRARQYREGDDLTVVAFGAMVYEALAAAEKSDEKPGKFGIPSCCNRWRSSRSSNRSARPAGCWWCRNAARRKAWAIWLFRGSRGKRFPR